MKNILINPNKVEFDNLNPNEMSEQDMLALRQEIKKHGFIQPVILRRKKNKAYVIDGEHRVTVARELGLKEIPAIDLGEIDDLTARVLLVNLNKIKGEFNPVKFAILLEKLEQETEQIRELLYMTEQEFNSYKLLRNLQSKQDQELNLIIEDQELTYEKTQGKLLIDKILNDLEINKTEQIVKIKDRVIPFSRIKKMQINFTKSMEAILHLEIKPVSSNNDTK